MEGKAGPTRIIIETLRCRFCKYHQSNMVMSGRNPLYAHYCSHPDLPDWSKSWVMKGWRMLGDDDYTPDWCPEK